MGLAPEFLQSADRLAAAVTCALDREREACAAVAERLGHSHPSWQGAAASIAAAIRDRGRSPDRQKPEKNGVRRALTLLELSRGRHYCVRCLAASLRSSLRVAQQAMKELSRTEGFDVSRHWCRGCGDNREVVCARLDHAPRRLG
ncbi:MAG TPA: hypothetical protein VLF19_05430 [Methylomirabilota bacterium]|nr:hypothetical protein [Methylomirabilota bacterium]